MKKNSVFLTVLLVFGVVPLCSAGLFRTIGDKFFNFCYETFEYEISFDKENFDQEIVDGIRETEKVLGGKYQVAQLAYVLGAFPGLLTRKNQQIKDVFSKWLSRADREFCCREFYWSCLWLYGKERCANEFKYLLSLRPEKCPSDDSGEILYPDILQEHEIWKKKKEEKNKLSQEYRDLYDF